MADDLVQWDKVKGLERSGIPALLEEQRTKKAILDRAKEALTEVQNKILAALVKAGVKTVGVGETRLTRVGDGVTPTKKFDKDVCYTALLELGVPQKKVDKAFKAATTEGEPKEIYLLVTEPKVKEEKGGKGK